MRWQDAAGLLRNRRFATYFGARTVNWAGSMMATVALAFAVLDVSDDPAALGQVLAAHTIPMVVLLLWGGVLADRFPRIVVMQVCNIVSAVSQGLIAILVVTGAAEVWMLVVLSVVHGTVSAASLPAMAAVMPSLVPRSDLQQANALMSLVRQGLAVLGPTLAALLVVAVGPGWALMVDAVTWVGSTVLLGFVRIPHEPAEESASTFAQLAAGWQFFRSTTWLWVVVLGFGFLNAITAGAWTTLGPVQAKQTIGEQGWGAVLSAQALGFLLAGLVMLRVPLRRPLLSGMLGMTTMAIPLLLLGLHPSLWLLMIGGFLAGVGTEVFGMGWNLAMQENVPGPMLSRVYSYDMLGSFIAMPIGQLAAGPVALAFGYGPVMVGAAVGYVVVCLAVLASSSVRRLGRVSDEGETEAGLAPAAGSPDA